MFKIPLTQGKFALVDKIDLKRIQEHKWYAYTDGYNWYAGRTVNRRPYRMHTEILNPRPGLFIDHKNGNGLDNRRTNLRIVTHQQNCLNRKKRSDNSSGYKGVNFNKNENKYVARIQTGGKRISLGYFHTAEEAAEAYERASMKYHREYARTI